MDSDPSKGANGGRRKLKFAPRAPPRRAPKKEVKPELVENDDADQAKDIMRRFNEREMRAKHKVEKKVSASQIAFGYGGESTSIKSYGFPKGANSSQNSEVNGVTQKEYKEPWDYYSEYPVTLPLRRPYSGNPEYLDEEEFGEAAESRTYDEDSANSAVELGLLEENPETSVFLMHLPTTLPMTKQSATAGGKDVNENTKRHGGSKDEEKKPHNQLKDVPAGFMGKMLVYKSGAVKLKLGDTLYDVNSGMNCAFAQDLVSINIAKKDCCAIGEINKCATITPDVDAVIDSLAAL